MKWKLVPEEPLQIQIDAAWEYVQTVPQTHDTMRGIYKAMLVAAPQPEHDRDRSEPKRYGNEMLATDNQIETLRKQP